MTLIAITCDAALANHTSTLPRITAVTRKPGDWHIGLQLGPATLRTVDPLPQVMQILMELQGLQAHRERLYVVLAELYTNALEHGVLGLDSAMKQTLQGVVAFYTARERALAALEHGSITMTLTHTAVGPIGQLTLRVEDSGPGFDYHAYALPLTDNAAPSGRGIPLVRTLCQSVIYPGTGNCVEAVYRWS